MELTGKAKKDFEKWYIKNIFLDMLKSKLIYKDQFFNLPQAMQYGVYVDWFDSVGIELVVMNWNNKFSSSIYINKGTKRDNQINERKGFKTRQQARTEAIKKANEIYNKQ